MLRITNMRAHAVAIPRDFAEGTGTAGSPVARRDAAATYSRAATYGTIYSSRIETVLVRVETDAGLTGWGEAQAPVAPEVTAGVVNNLLAPVLAGADALAPEQRWNEMYELMRVRGQTGGFMLDAIAGVDIALWDVCGKAYGQPVCRLLGGTPDARLPAYVSGLAGADPAAQIAYARRHVEQGARTFKLFLGATTGDCLRLVDDLRAEFADGIEIFVDALWRLSLKEAERFAAELRERQVGWLEAPLAPEDVEGHARLARASQVPVAVGESYRTRYELLPFFERRALDIAQPDAGRTGITEGRKIAALADAFHCRVAPHVSIGLGVQIAAALHLAAATTNLRTVECNPQVYQVANRFLREPLRFESDGLHVPTGAGLGISVDEAALERFVM